MPTPPSTYRLVTSDGSHFDVEGFYRAPDTGTFAWAVVNVSRLDRKSRLVPLDAAWFDSEGIHVPYGLARILAAPPPGDPTALRVDEEAALRDHYEGPSSASGAPRQTAVATMVRSEERLRISRLEWRPYRRTRFRVVVREHEEVRRVRVRVQELVVEDEAPSLVERLEMLNDVAAADTGEIELVLHREEVVVSTRVVPYERVRIHKDVVADTFPIEEELRKERIDVERRPVRGSDRAPQRS